jgi:4-hydroxybutyryl-CoA dehydratase/vinylacetyl-CoA-Delta-isomerase
MTPEDADFAVCCAVPCDAPGRDDRGKARRAAGRGAAKFSAKYGSPSAS